MQSLPLDAKLSLEVTPHRAGLLRGAFVQKEGCRAKKGGEQPWKAACHQRLGEEESLTVLCLYAICFLFQLLL